MSSSIGAKLAKLYRQDQLFLDGYLEAMAFTDMGADDEAKDCELADETVKRIHADCIEFQKAAAELLELAYALDDYGPAQAGRDFWFTRNGHGVGYWDRKELEAGGLGDRLTALCGDFTPFPSVDVYRGDDGKAYFA